MNELFRPQGDPDRALIELERFHFFYGRKQALFDINLAIPARQVTALIGPSGCGKTTLLRNLNRMNDMIEGVRHTGDIRVAGRSLFDPALRVIELRKRVGMVFQRYNPFVMSVYENVVFSLRVAGRAKKPELDECVERTLREVGLWDEVKDRLNSSAFELSGGQQQRLCIARAIANQPEILLMDEPCASLDPMATLKIEELISSLKERYTIVIVTHSMEQAARCSDSTAFLYMGMLVEHGETMQVFSNPRAKETEDYVTGRFS